ncbi:hypothetical protein HEP84_57480 [Streptomyces sp. RLB1-33]|nr:hypothetical protein [Streptomyces sp. RLB1-33]
MERFFYQRSGSQFIEVPGASHVPMISHPATTTRLIQTATKATA